MPHVVVHLEQDGRVIPTIAKALILRHTMLSALDLVVSPLQCTVY